jgi:hypothetical protein
MLKFTTKSIFDFSPDKQIEANNIQSLNKEYSKLKQRIFKA